MFFVKGGDIQGGRFRSAALFFERRRRLAGRSLWHCRIHLAGFLLLLAAAAPATLPSAAAGETGRPAPATVRLIDNGGYAVTRGGEYLAVYNPDKLLVPASIIKIATALAALDLLGPQYRFETFFYIDAQANLYIKGTGDPFLTSEEVSAVVRQLKALGCTRINDIYIDSTAFELEAAVDGAGGSDNPYDAQNSGLAVNFNTINVSKKSNGRVVSAEAQTPTLALMKVLAAGLPSGTHRINITRQETDGAAWSSRYVGELFRAMQEKEGIAGAGKVTSRKTPIDLGVFYVHQSSRSLADIIGPLMRYSNNFIANQIFLMLGAYQYGYPATWQKSRQAMAAYLQEEHGLAADAITMSEGSGLSRKNRVSPRAMIRLLDAFKPYRRFLAREDGRRLKSGTLDGVYSYAGYFLENDNADSFVLLLNQGKNNRDRVLDLLERAYRAGRRN